jgi:hypothetical protein
MGKGILNSFEIDSKTLIFGVFAPVSIWDKYV